MFVLTIATRIQQQPDSASNGVCILKPTTTIQHTYINHQQRMVLLMLEGQTECVCVCVCPQLSSTSSWLGVGNVLCAAKSTQELIVLIIAMRSSPGIIGRLPFLGFATQDWYRLARETDRHLSVSCLLGTAITIVLLWAAYCGCAVKCSCVCVCVCVCACVCVHVCVSACVCVSSCACVCVCVHVCVCVCVCMCVCMCVCVCVCVMCVCECVVVCRAIICLLCIKKLCFITN